jgi:hypothetical protein
MHADSLAGGSLAGGSLAGKTEKGTKRTLHKSNYCILQQVLSSEKKTLDTELLADNHVRQSREDLVDRRIGAG